MSDFAELCALRVLFYLKYIIIVGVGYRALQSNICDNKNQK